MARNVAGCFFSAAGNELDQEGVTDGSPLSSSLHSADMMTDRGETLQASHQQTWLTVFTGMHDIYMYIYSVLYIYIYNNEAAVVKLHLIMFDIVNCGWNCGR